MVFVKQVEVLLNAPERALRFCNILSACEGPFDLGRGSYTENVLEKIREFLV